MVGWSSSGLFCLGKSNFGSISSPSLTLWWGTLLAFAEIFFGQVTSDEVPQLWLLGSLFACLKQGVLGLFDLQACNRSFLGKQLWNIHVKMDSVWIRWIHHFYLNSGTIWSVHAYHSSSPLWKVIISIRDLLLQLCGDSESSITLLSSWFTGAGFFLSHAYDFFKPVSSTVSWGWVVWEQWSLPKYSFILWLAVLGKLRTRVRLVFVPTNPNCMFCRQVEESYSHLFCACEWTCCLCAMIKSWLRIGRTMQTLINAIQGLHSQRNNLEARLRRVSLGITVYLIWEERNKRIFDGQSKEIATMFRRFQILFYIVFHFYEKDYLILYVGWLGGLLSLNCAAESSDLVSSWFMRIVATCMHGPCILVLHDKIKLQGPPGFVFGLLCSLAYGWALHHGFSPW
jgi:hypothetical protein